MNKNLPFLSLFVFFTIISCSGLGAGWSAYEAKNYDEAQRIAARQLLENPKDPEVYRLIAYTHIAKGNYPQAVSAAKLGASFSNDSLESLIALQESYKYAQDWPHFCDVTHKLFLEAPERAQDSQLLISAAVESSRRNPASAFGCYVPLVREEGALMRDEQFQSAASAYAALLAQNGNYRGAMKLLSPLEDDKYNAFQFGQYAYEIREIETGEAAFFRYLQGAQGADELSSRNEALAEFYASKRKYAQALDYYQASAGHSAARKRLDLALRGRDIGHIEDSLREIVESGDLSEREYVDLSNNLSSFAYADLGIKLLEQGLVKYPGSLEIALQMATLYERTGEIDKRRSVFESLESSKGNDERLVLEEIFKWYADRSYFMDARAYGEKRVLLGEPRFEFLLALAQVYANTRDYDAMERILDQSIMLSEKSNEKVIESRLAASQIAQKHLSWRKSITYLLPILEKNPGPSHPAWDLSTAYERSDSLDLSHQVLMRWAKASGKEAESLLEIARYYHPYQHKRQQHFEEVMGELLKQSSLQVEAHLLYAQHWYSLGDESKVVSECELAIKESDSEEQGFTRIIGFLEDSLGARRLAIDFARKAIEKYPETLSFYKSLAVLELSVGEDESAYQTFLRYVEKSEDKSKAAGSCLQDFQRYSRSELAKDWLDELVIKNPGDNELLEIKSNHLFSMYYAHQSENPEYARSLRASAVNDLERYLELSQNARKMQDLGVSHSSRGEHELATRVFERASALASLNNTSRRYQIKSLSSQGRVDEARLLVERFAASSEIEDKEILLLAQELSSLDRSEIALPLYERLLKVDNFSMNRDAYTRLVSLAIDNGDRGRVELLSQAFEQKHPNQIEALDALFHTWQELEDWPRAISVWEQIANLRPNASDLLPKLLRVFAIEGEDGLSAPILRNYLENTPTLASALEEIGSFYDKRGENLKALSYYRRAVSLASFPSAYLLRRALHLELNIGEVDKAAELISKIKDIGAWDVATILLTSKDYYQIGSRDLAQSLLDEAISSQAKEESLHLLRISQAFEEGDNAKALVFIEDYLQNDLSVSKLIRTLINHNAINQANYQVEQLSSSFLFDEALYNTLLLQDEISDNHGKAKLSIDLKSLLHNTKQPELAYSALTRIALSDENIQEAIAYALQSEEEELQMSVLAHDLQYRHVLLEILENKTQGLNPKDRLEFKRNTLRKYYLEGYEDLAEDFAQQNVKPELVAELSRLQMALNREHFDEVVGILYTGRFSDLLGTEPSQESRTQYYLPLNMLLQASQQELAFELSNDWYEAAAEGSSLKHALWLTMLEISGELGNKNLKSPDKVDELLVWARNHKDKIDLEILHKLGKAVTPQTLSEIISLYLQYAAKNPNKTEEIRTALSEIRDKSSNRLDIESVLVRASFDEKNYEIAREYSQELIRKRPRVAAYYLNNARALKATDKLEDSIQALKQAVLRESEPMLTLKSEVLSYANAKEAKYVLPIVEEILSHEPHSTEMNLLKLKLLLLDQKNDEALRFSEEWMKKNDSPLLRAAILRTYRDHSASALIPSSWLALEALNDEGIALVGNIKVEQNMMQEAAETFLLSAKRSLNPLIFLLLGANALIEAKNHQYAEQLIENAIQSYPNSGKPRLMRAKLMVQENQVDAALEDFDFAMRHSLKPAEILLDFTSFLLKNDKIQLARDCLKDSQKYSILNKEERIAVGLESFIQAKKGKEGLESIAQIFGNIESFLKLKPQLARKYEELQKH